MNVTQPLWSCCFPFLCLGSLYSLLWQTHIETSLSTLPENTPSLSSGFSCQTCWKCWVGRLVLPMPLCHQKSQHEITCHPEGVWPCRSQIILDQNHTECHLFFWFNDQLFPMQTTAPPCRTWLPHPSGWCVQLQPWQGMMVPTKSTQ